MQDCYSAAIIRYFIIELPKIIQDQDFYHLCLLLYDYLFTWSYYFFSVLILLLSIVLLKTYSVTPLLKIITTFLHNTHNYYSGSWEILVIIITLQLLT